MKRDEMPEEMADRVGRMLADDIKASDEREQQELEAS